MNKVAHYLQEHLLGEVVTSNDARKYFSTDGGVFTVTPNMVVYPENENDLRKTARFTWQLAERGRVIPITARGAGSDQSGGAIGSGIVLVMPGHMNKLLDFDNRRNTVVVQPGLNYSKLQETLKSHGRFLPPYPSSIEFSTLGGAVGNNASGEKTVKYGSTRDYVNALRVVLANGEVIETHRLSKRELNKKLGLSSFEGEIYRSMDKLIEEHHQVIDSMHLDVTKNSAGYDLIDVKRKDGSFDLTPLFVGSQGTLGIISEITFETEAHSPDTTLIAAFFHDLEIAQQVILELRKLPELPSAMEVVDDNLLNFVDKLNPNQLKGIVDKPFHKLIALIEFDNLSERTRSRITNRALKVLHKHNVEYQMETKPEAKDRLWKLRHSAAALMAHSEGSTKALPIIEDGIVPVEKFGTYLKNVYEIFDKHHLTAAIWGHAGNANLHMEPFLDLSVVGDRQKVFKVIDDYYTMVIGMGGSTSAEHSDGRLRGPYLQALYGDDAYSLFGKVKQIFDPYGTLNPGVKIGVTLDDVKPLLREEYSMNHLYDHLPKS